MRAASGAAALVVCLCLVAAACSGAGRRVASLRIGVLMPLTGADSGDFNLPLQWAVDNVNQAGGVDGRPLKLDYVDIAKHDVVAASRRFAADPDVVAVIGPDSSDRVFQVAPAFVAAHKVMVTPTATSGDIFRAFSSSTYVWRTVQSDIGQVHTELQLAARDGARRVALLAGLGHYGTTFYDWGGFFANELGLQPAAVVRYDQATQNCRTFVDQALAAHPDVLVAAPKDRANAVCMAEEWRAKGSPGRLLFTDAARGQGLITSLGKQAEGLEGLGLGPDPAGGFVTEFTSRFHRSPTEAAASVYDSVLIIALGLQRSGGRAGAALASAMTQVVDGRGQSTSWDEQGIVTALRLIATGQLPDINGATGPLTYDSASHTDLLVSTYTHWRVEGGVFHPVEYLRSSPVQAGMSDARLTPQAGEAGHFEPTTEQTYQPVTAKQGLWALLVATSSGWDNYRHQADVLAQYQLLRHNGVPADHIIVVAQGDLPSSPRNPHPGTVVYQEGGPDIAQGVPIDYRLSQIDATTLLDILAGRRSAALPRVVDSSSADDVYVFIAGHGDQQGVYVGLSEPVPRPGDQYSVLTPAALSATVNQMASAGRYRRMLIAVEACKGGVMGSGLTAPGALLVAGASPSEDSISTGYDAAAGTWLADEFAQNLWKAEGTAATQKTPMSAALASVYLSVGGSHVSVYGTHFGDTQSVSLGEFVTP